MGEEDLVEIALWLVVRMDLIWLIMSAKRPMWRRGVAGDGCGGRLTRMYFGGAGKIGVKPMG